jgi:hypothetical protein
MLTRIGRQQASRQFAEQGLFTVDLPPASAALVTFSD